MVVGVCCWLGGLLEDLLIVVDGVNYEKFFLKLGVIMIKFNIWVSNKEIVEDCCFDF